MCVGHERPRDAQFEQSDPAPSLAAESIVGRHPDSERRYADAISSAAEGHVADLTHRFRSGFPVARYEPPRREQAADFAREGSRNQRWTLVEHSGTHVDAPAHFFPDMIDVSELDPRDLIVPVAVIDIAARAVDDLDYLVTREDILRFESQHGAVPPRSGVFMRTGWDRRAENAVQFMGLDEGGVPHSPGFSPDAVDWLISERDIACIGVDTPSIDPGPSVDFPVHQRLLGSGRYAIECLARLASLPPSGAVATVGVIPWENGSGGPCRVMAWW
jgi:kynurenine formamidase